MRYSAAFADQLDALGIWWPRGDGDALRSAARAWTDVATLLDDIARSLDDAQAGVAETYRGPAAAALAELWAAWTGDDGHLATTAGDCRRLAAAATDFGGDVDVAHATLVDLIETVMRDDGVATSEEVAWLREAAGEVGDQLDRRASVRGRGLATIAELAPRAPLDRTSIDPTHVSWVDPGDPDDLSFLATDEVDLGAGQGEITALLPGAPSPGPGWWHPGPARPPDDDDDDRPCGPPVSCPPPTTCLPPIDRAPTDDTADDASDDSDDASDDAAAWDGELARVGVQAARVSTIDAPVDSPDVAGGLGGGGGGAGGSFGGGGSFDPGIDLSGIYDDVASAPAGGVEAAAFTPSGTDVAVPVRVGPPATSNHTTTPAPPTAPLTTPVDAGAAGGRSGRMPFFPMMPMMGGMGGDDGDEPRRRRARRPRWPAPPATEPVHVEAVGAGDASADRADR